MKMPLSVAERACECFGAPGRDEGEPNPVCVNLRIVAFRALVSHLVRVRCRFWIFLSEGC